MGIMKDINGKTSGKRFFGGLLLIAGVFVGVWGAVLKQDVAGILWPILTTGAALLGVTVMERKDSV